MRRRLVITYVLMLALVLLALEVPLGSNVAAGHTDEMVLDRLLDANRIASIAEPALREGRLEGITAGLEQYNRVYGVSAAVANREAALIAVSGDVGAFASGTAQRSLRQALAGSRAGGAGTVWPWDPEPLVLA